MDEEQKDHAEPPAFAKWLMWLVRKETWTRQPVIATVATIIVVSISFTSVYSLYKLWNNDDGNHFVTIHAGEAEQFANDWIEALMVNDLNAIVEMSDVNSFLFDVYQVKSETDLRARASQLPQEVIDGMEESRQFAVGTIEKLRENYPKLWRYKAIESDNKLEVIAIAEFGSNGFQQQRAFILLTKSEGVGLKVRGFLLE